MKKTIEIVITEQDVKEYNDMYFRYHPRATKKRIDAPRHPTLNWYVTANTMSVNNKKQEWKSFILYILEKNNLLDMGIDRCEIIYRTFFKDLIIRDLDNITPKFIFDGMVEGGFIVADDYKHIVRLVTECGHDKENPRIELIVNLI